MARAGLDKNRKFQRFAHGLNAILPGMAPVLARGLLETLWSAAYERADDHLGDADDVEIAAGWTGARGMLANLLLVAGGETAKGFIEADEDRGGYKIHAFWEHAPPWVKVKSDRAAARAASGKTISDVRREAGRASQFKPTANGQPVAGQTVNPLPEPTTAKNSLGTGRDGTGIKDPGTGVAAPPLSLVPDDPSSEQRTKAPPLPFKAEEAIADVQRAAGAAFIAPPGKPARGHVIAIQAHIRRFPDRALWPLLGDFLASGHVAHLSDPGPSWLASDNMPEVMTRAIRWRDAGKPSKGANGTAPTFPPAVSIRLPKGIA